jgi:hypothetical protein
MPLRPIDFCVTRKGVWDSEPSVCWCRSLPVIPSSGTPDAHAPVALRDELTVDTQPRPRHVRMGEESVDAAARVVGQLEGRIDPVV